MPRLNKTWDELAATAAAKGIDVSRFDAIREINEDAAKSALNKVIKETKVGRGRKSTKVDPVQDFLNVNGEMVQELLSLYRNVEDALNQYNAANDTKLIVDLETPNVVKVKGARGKRNTSGATNGATPASKVEYDWTAYAAKLKANKASNRLMIVNEDEEEVTATLQVNGSVKDKDGTYENVREWARTYITRGNYLKLIKVQHNGATVSLEKAYRETMK